MKKFEEKTGCLRCGKCCYYTDYLGVKRKCRFLVILPDKTTLCRVYKTRLGRIVGIGLKGKPVYCMPRIAHGYEPGCPLNP